MGVIIATLMFLPGCASSNRSCLKVETTQETHSADSVMEALESVTAQTTTKAVDSGTVTSRLLRVKEGVPEAESNMTIPMRSLLDLPEGAGYSARNGRSSVGVERHGDELRVTGRCDSLERQCSLYEEALYWQEYRADSLEMELTTLERELELIRNDTRSGDYIETTETKAPPNYIAVMSILFFAGIVAGSLITILIIIRKNGRKRT